MNREIKRGCKMVALGAMDYVAVATAAFALPVQLYWHCWNLQSEVLDALTNAISDAATASLVT